jgi:ribosome-associated protein
LKIRHHSGYGDVWRVLRFASEDFDLVPHLSSKETTPALAATGSAEPDHTADKAKTTSGKATTSKPRAAKSKAGKNPETAQAETRPSILDRVSAALEDMKAEEVVEIDLAGKTSLADTMIIASGRSNRHVGAIADRIVEFVKLAGHPSPRVEGQPHCDWVLIDAGDVIAHVFRPDVRQFYNLEKMWAGDRPSEQTAESRTPLTS